MIEFFNLVASYWEQSKADWKQNRSRLFTLFGFALLAYLILDFGSYFFAAKLNEARTENQIRSEFIDRRVNMADDFITQLFALKESTNTMLISINNSSPKQCNKILQDLNIKKLVSGLFVSASNIRYFFGDSIADELSSLLRWYDANDDDCFKNIQNSGQVLDKKFFSVRNQIWSKMYPPEIIKGIR